MENNKDKNESVIVLPESITISECQDQFSLLIENLKGNGSIELDAANVKHADTAALQLLAALQKSSNNEISWREVSEELLKNASALGLEAHLSLNK